MSDRPADRKKTPGALGGPKIPIPRGTSALDLRVGPLLLRVEQLPVDWHPFVEEHYGYFATKPNTGRSPDLVVTCREGSAETISVPPTGGFTQLDIDDRGDGTFGIRSHWQDGSIDTGSGRAELTLTDRTYHRFRMSLENFLRVTAQLMLVERDAFLLHCAGLLDEGRCHVFFGPSGAGKSTAKSNSGDRPALSDDIVLIDASGDAPVAHAVPFFGSFPPEERAAGAWPVALFARLRQSPEDRLERLSEARAVATISASIPFVHELGVRCDRIMEVVARACAGAPTVDLHLTNSGRFWETVREVTDR